MNIVDVIRAETEPIRNRTAVIDGDHELSYVELLTAVDTLKAGLKNEGITAGRRIAFLCRDSADYITASLAVLSLNAAIVPISPSLTPDELTDVLERIDVHGLLFDSALRSDPEAVPVPANQASRTAFRFARRSPADSMSPEYDGLNAAFIRFSSGTTGESKGVLLSHETILERTAAADAGLNITPDDTILWVLSMSFHFVVSILLFLRRGATVVLCGDNLPSALETGLVRHGGTFIYAGPFHYWSLARSNAVESSSLARVRLAISTATALPQDIARTFLEKFGIHLTSAYGIIEIGLPFINTMPDRKPGSVGPALPGYSVRIADPNHDGIGRIMIRGPGMFDAYCSPWRLRNATLVDGWFDTGDIGRLDEDRFLFILGREKDVINFAGMKVFPYEVEAVLNRHPAVRESLVYPEPHPQYGQLPCARVVLNPDAGEKIDPTDLRRHCARHLAPFKIPKDFTWTDRLERTASDKLKRT